MGTIYSEFDTTPATWLADVKAKILTSADWADITPTAVLLNTSVAPSAGATTLTFTATAGFPLIAGQVIAIDTAGAREYRVINTVTATTITLTAGLTSAHSIGVGIYNGAILLKATTTRGAQMVIDLNDGVVNGQQSTIAFYRTHDGTNTGGVDRLGPRYLFHRGNVGATTSTLHMTVSAGKEHLFISVEGTRGHETGAYTTFGGQKTYAFICDVVPYHVADTIPVVAVSGASAVTSQSWTNNAHQVWVSRGQGNAASWVPARLHTLCQPDLFTTLNQMGYQPEALGDGKYYVFPYVVIEETDGLRGRLSDFFFGGFNDGVLTADVYPAVGRRITYNSKTYKLLQVNKSEGTSGWSVWGPFGASVNGGNTTQQRSMIVAVPVV